MERGWGEDPHVYSGWVTGLVLLHYYYEYYEYSLSPLSHSQLLFHRHLPLAAIISSMGLRPWLWLSMIVKTNKLYEHPIDWDWIIITCDGIQHSSTKSRKYSSLCSCKQVTVFTIQSLFLVFCLLSLCGMFATSARRLTLRWKNKHHRAEQSGRSSAVNCPIQAASPTRKILGMFANSSVEEFSSQYWQSVYLQLAYIRKKKKIIILWSHKNILPGNLIFVQIMLLNVTVLNHTKTY